MFITTVRQNNLTHSLSVEPMLKRTFIFVFYATLVSLFLSSRCANSFEDESELFFCSFSDNVCASQKTERNPGVAFSVSSSSARRFLDDSDDDDGGNVVIPN